MSDNKDDVILSGIDSFLPLEKTQMNILEMVDNVTIDAIDQGNPKIAAEAMRSLLGVSQISGLAFSKFIYVMSFQWKNFSQSKHQAYEDWAIDEFGRQKKSIKDNYNVWAFLVSGDVDKKYVDRFKTMPVRCLIPIANLWKQEWEVAPHQWMRLSEAPDPSTINKIIREIKQKEPKAGSLQIEWTASEKKITCWKDGTPHNIYLQYDEEDKTILAGLERLLGSGRTLEK